MSEDIVARLRKGLPACWLKTGLRAAPKAKDPASEAINVASARWQRFAPVLAQACNIPSWDGVVRSPLRRYPRSPDWPQSLYVKCDHALPITGSVKARGGVYEVLCLAERIAAGNGLLNAGDGRYLSLLEEPARKALGSWTVVTASTGNLGFSVGVMARALGLKAEIHMSMDAKQWKKDRLRQIGACVVEHATDYTGTLAAARTGKPGERRHFIDDEASLDLFMGYTCGGMELASQLKDLDIEISERQPLFVYLPCGVGGAPGGITYALRAAFGPAVVCIFVEPVASACMLLALDKGRGEPQSVYDYGLDNRTDADGLAVSRASGLVLQKVGEDIDAVVALPDAMMRAAVRRVWAEAGLRLELSAAAGFAAIEPLHDVLKQTRATQLNPIWRRFDSGLHVVWTTGGSMLPEEEFVHLLA